MGEQVEARINGGVAQLGEHLPCKQGVMSSNLTISTKVMKRVRSVRSWTSECIYANELEHERTKGYSKNTRDEHDAKHLRICGHLKVAFNCP